MTQDPRALPPDDDDLEEAVLRAMLATYEERPGPVIDRCRGELSDALAAVNEEELDSDEGRRGVEVSEGHAAYASKAGEQPARPSDSCSSTRGLTAPAGIKPGRLSSSESELDVPHGERR